MSVRRTVGVVLLSAAVLFAGCGPPAVPYAPLGALPDAAPGELITVFTIDDADRDGDNFSISSAVGQPDGTALVHWDPNAEQAGDDELNDVPTTSVLGTGGLLRTIEEPGTGGYADGTSPWLLGAGPDGTAYFLDRTPARSQLVARTVGGRWSVVPSETRLLPETVRALAVGPDGTVVLVDGAGVLRILPDGQVDVVVRAKGAPPLPVDFVPRPATEVTLAEVYGLAVGDDGTVYAATREEIVAVDPAGVLRLVTTGQGLNDALGIVNDLDPAYRWTELAIDADGSLLIGDAYQQLLVDLDGPEVITEDVRLPFGGAHVDWSPQNDLLVIQVDPRSLEAGPDDPPRLAVLGR